MGVKGLRSIKKFIFSYSVFSFSKVKNTLSGRMAMLLEDKYLLRKRLSEKILLKKLNPRIYPAGNIIRTNLICNFDYGPLKNVCSLLERV